MSSMIRSIARNAEKAGPARPPVRHLILACAGVNQMPCAAHRRLPVPWASLRTAAHLAAELHRMGWLMGGAPCKATKTGEDMGMGALAICGQCGAIARFEVNKA